MLNHEVYEKGLMRLANFFKKETVSDLFLDDYYQAVKDLTDEAFTRAIDHLIKNHKSGFFPVPAQLLEAVQATKPAPTYLDENKLLPNFTKMLEGKSGGVPCPPEVKEMMKKTIEKINARKLK